MSRRNRYSSRENDDEVRRARGSAQRIILLQVRWEGNPDGTHGYVNYFVAGTTNCYFVSNQSPWQCECPDWTRKGGTHKCKHIYFILDKVLSKVTGIANDQQFAIYQKLRERFSELTQINREKPVVSVASSRRTKRARTNHERDEKEQVIVVEDDDEIDLALSLQEEKELCVEQRPLLGESCPYCCEDFTNAEADHKTDGILFCKTQCGKSMHKACFLQGFHVTKKAACPFCRAGMPVPVVEKQKKRKFSS